MKIGEHYVTPQVARIISGPAISSYREANANDFSFLGKAISGATFGDLTGHMQGNSSQKSKALKDHICAALHSIRSGDSPHEFNERFAEFVADQLNNRGSKRKRDAVVPIRDSDFFDDEMASKLAAISGPKNASELSLMSLKEKLAADMPASSRAIERTIKELEANIHIGTEEELQDQTERIKLVGTMALTGLLYRNMIVRLKHGDATAVEDAITLAGLSPKARSGPLIAQQFVNGKGEVIGKDEVKPAMFEDRIRRAEQRDAEDKERNAHALPAGPEGLSG